MKNLELFGKLLPIGSIVILLCSSMKLVLFYNAFNISISDFLTIGEYATLFVDDILYYLMIFGLGVFIDIVSPNSNIMSESKDENKDYTVYEKERKYIIRFIILITALSTCLCFLVNKFTLKLEIAKLASYFILISFYGYALFSKIKFNYLSLIITALFLYSGFDGYIDSQKIIENKTNVNFKVILKDVVIQTNEDLHYLGKSDKYLFFYEIKNKKSLIYTYNDLIKMEIIK